jgi:hypothetical protein
MLRARPFSPSRKTSAIAGSSDGASSGIIANDRKIARPGILLRVRQ